MEDEYNIASEIKSETKVAGKLLVSTFYFLCFYWILFYSLRVFVHTQLMLIVLLLVALNVGTKKTKKKE